jgi:hypothetical protein
MTRLPRSLKSALRVGSRQASVFSQLFVLTEGENDRDMFHTSAKVRQNHSL